MKQNFKSAKLMVCASCEWIFKGNDGCPKCGFAYYTAHYVYGDKAYRYAKTQQPWMDKKMFAYQMKRLAEIEQSQEEINPCLP